MTIHKPELCDNGQLTYLIRAAMFCARRQARENNALGLFGWEGEQGRVEIHQLTAHEAGQILRETNAKALDYAYGPDGWQGELEYEPGILAFMDSNDFKVPEVLRACDYFEDQVRAWPGWMNSEGKRILDSMRYHAYTLLGGYWRPAFVAGVPARERALAGTGA